jgi:hypothetical protein
MDRDGRAVWTKICLQSGQQMVFRGNQPQPEHFQFGMQPEFEHVISISYVTAVFEGLVHVSRIRRPFFGIGQEIIESPA